MRKLLTTTAIIAVAAAPLAAADRAGPMSITEAVAAGDVTVAQLINRPVHVRTGADDQVSWSDWTGVPDSFELSGEIEDLLLDQDGRIDSAVIGQGGILDIGETEVQADIGQFAVVMDADDRGDFYVVYTGDAADLSTAQPYQGPGDGETVAMKKAPDMNAQNPGQDYNRKVVESASEGEVRGASNVERSSTQQEMEAAGQDLMGYASRETDTGGADARWTTTSAREAQREAAARGDYFGAAPAFNSHDMTPVAADSLTVDDLEWVPVYNRADERVGEIGDLTLGENGRVSAAIIDMGGFLGIGETPVEVPFDKLTLKREDDSGELRAYVALSDAAIQRLKTDAGG